MNIFLAYTFGIIIAVSILYIIGLILAPYKPDSIKNDHFECGLPASSNKPKKANFNFFVYAVMFIAADMTGLFFTLFVYGELRESMLMASIFAFIMAGGITIAMREYNYAENS